LTDRAYDIVLFGATGFTGGLTAEYLAQNAPPDLRWALAGRSPAKLEDVRARLVKINPALADLALVKADVNDKDSIDALAASTRVIVTTVGPYALYGESLVAACAEAGTDYADLCGEPEFVDEMFVKYNERAVQTGARLVHCCGFDSIPHDLGAYFTVLQLPEGKPIKVEGFVKTNAQFSGGTMASALNGFASARNMLKVAKQRKKIEARPAGRKIKAINRAPHRVKYAGGWVAPLPTIDGDIVRRSAAKLDRYGPEFSYGHNLAAKNPLTIVGMAIGVSLVAILAQIPPLRRGMGKFVAPGEGPSPERREKSWFRVRFIGEANGQTVHTEISGGDPGYTETAKMLAESALALALDDAPEAGGQLSPVAAIGDALLDRLPKAGIKLSVTS
jgi:short subunit dehydrogenase-like uncharacterized protein